MQLAIQGAVKRWRLLWLFLAAISHPTVVFNSSFADEGAIGAPSEADRSAMAVEALSRLQGMDLNQNPKIKEALLKVLGKTRGTPGFAKLVKQFKLTDQDAGLLEVAIQNPANESGVEAMRLILANQNFTLLQTSLESTNSTVALKTAEALGNTREKEAARLLLPVITEPNRDIMLRKQAVRGLAQTPQGAAALLELAREEKLADNLKFTASSELNRVRWPEIKAEAATRLPPPKAQNAETLPPVAELLKMKGDPANGANVFSSPTAGCANCHQVKGQGVDFGPNLTEIGAKLGKDAIYESILDPSAGISFGFEAWQIQLKSGDEAYGLIVSETAEELAIKAVGGIITRSIMPAGLQQAMSTQELVDLVEYLFSLKKSS